MSKNNNPKELTIDPSTKHPTSYKLTNTALGIVTYLSTKRGIAKSALIENLLRDAYQAEVEREKQEELKRSGGLLKR